MNLTVPFRLSVALRTTAGSSSLLSHSTPTAISYIDTSSLSVSILIICDLTSFNTAFNRFIDTLHTTCRLRNSTNSNAPLFALTNLESAAKRPTYLLRSQESAWRRPALGATLTDKHSQEIFAASKYVQEAGTLMAVSFSGYFTNTSTRLELAEPTYCVQLASFRNIKPRSTMESNWTYGTSTSGGSLTTARLEERHSAP